MLSSNHKCYFDTIEKDNSEFSVFYMFLRTEFGPETRKQSLLAPFAAMSQQQACREKNTLLKNKQQTRA